MNSKSMASISPARVFIRPVCRECPRWPRLPRSQRTASQLRAYLLPPCFHALPPPPSVLRLLLVLTCRRHAARLIHRQRYVHQQGQQGGTSVGDQLDL
jgi:hypothetical protein